MVLLEVTNSIDDINVITTFVLTALVFIFMLTTVFAMHHTLVARRDKLKLELDMVQKDESEPPSDLQIGQLAFLFLHVVVGEYDVTYNFPCIVSEVSVDEKLVSFELDYDRITDGYPCSNPHIMGRVEFLMNAWYHVSRKEIIWVETTPPEVEFSREEGQDIKSFLKYSMIPEEKKNYIKEILNI